MSTQSDLCEESTFSTVFREYAKTLNNYLFYKTGNKGLAQDLTQEAFTRLWQHCSDVIVANAKGYVFKTANNLLINEHKHQQVVLKFEHNNTTKSSVENPQFLMEEEELRLQIETAIAALPEKQRVVFLMSRIDKKTYAEIAAILGISKQAVEKRIYIALDKLRMVSKKIK